MQCRFINCNKCTPLGRDVDNEEDYAYVGAGGKWEISVLALQFFCEPKTALKKCLKKKRKRNELLNHEKTQWNPNAY